MLWDLDKIMLMVFHGVISGHGVNGAVVLLGVRRCNCLIVRIFNYDFIVLHT
jgi:hypothetical protein